MRSGCARSSSAALALAALALAFVPGCRSPTGSSVQAVEADRSGASVGASAPATDVARTAARRGGVATPRAEDGARAQMHEPAPDFTLPDLDGRGHALSALRGRIVVLEWFDPRSREVEYAHGEGPLREQPDRLAGRGVVWLCVNSNAPGEPGASIEENRAFAREHGLRNQILLDPSGVVGRAYRARTTPHLFVINEMGLLVYRGALDNAPLGVVEGHGPTINYVDAAIADLRSGHAVVINETRPYGGRVAYAKP